MQSSTLALRAKISDFLERTGLSPSYFGKKVRSSEIVKRLETGGTVTLETADRVHQFIADRKM
jgi:hypothetical protein